MDQRGAEDAVADDVHTQRRTDAGLLFVEDGLARERQVPAAILFWPAQARPAGAADMVFPGAAPGKVVGIGLAMVLGPCGLEARILGFEPLAHGQAEGFVFRRIAHLHGGFPCMGVCKKKSIWRPPSKEFKWFSL
ncbi:hypothetical protein SDC9_159796 [bioreactor metagenome]|uniref:Uncharacterized protein n=1 Tax=bioreactor metagenome TaxID=1076179 RepID=A0A645FDK1_9ZZZZ